MSAFILFSRLTRLLMSCVVSASLLVDVLSLFSPKHTSSNISQTPLPPLLIWYDHSYCILPL